MFNQSPKISVIIPTYNHSELIVETLESVIQQTFTDFECIIVNDGSTDNTEEVVKKWIKRDVKFRYYKQLNGGPSKARNTGIAVSFGKYILPLDSDDKISKNYLEEAYKILDSQETVKVVYGNAYFFGRTKKKWNLDPYNFEDLLYKNMIYCSGLYRKTDWQAVGGYDENLNEGLEDWEFWINILKNGGEVKKIDNIYFYYRQKLTSLNTESILKHSYGYKARIYIFEKHIILYRTTNFYDMYYENYNLKRSIKDPLRFLTYKDFLILIYKAFRKDVFYLFKVGKNKIRGVDIKDSKRV